MQFKSYWKSGTKLIINNMLINHKYSNYAPNYIQSYGQSLIYDKLSESVFLLGIISNYMCMVRFNKVCPIYPTMLLHFI